MRGFYSGSRLRNADFVARVLVSVLGYQDREAEFQCERRAWASTPGKSRNQTSDVLELHFSGKSSVNQDLA